MHIYLKASEVKLVETLNGITEPGNWHAIHFHLNDLLEQYKSEYQIKIAINLIHDLLKDYEGGIFLLADQGIIVLCYGMEKTLQNKLVFQLRYLYMDDPLAYTADGRENMDFSTSYELARNWQEFLDLASRRMALSVRRTAPAAAPARPEPRKAAPMPSVEPIAYPTLRPAAVPVPQERDLRPSPILPLPKTVFSASRLATIEQDLRRADLSHVIRRQPVCAAIPGHPVRRVFDELYIHIAHLRQMIQADVDFFSNRWLFKYVTQILDERMIDLVCHSPANYFDHPISLNLNIETLLSSWFGELDAFIKPSAKVGVVIEVPVVDAYADPTGFMFAKQEVQKLGYRVCLDGLTTKSFMSINREKLGLDLIKVQWNADAASDLQTQENRDFAHAVHETGTNRIILCRCDNRQAVDYGQAMGISLFQGRYIDSLLDPASAQQN